jgi:hypothetical protein
MKAFTTQRIIFINTVPLDCALHLQFTFYMFCLKHIFLSNLSLVAHSKEANFVIRRKVYLISNLFEYSSAQKLIASRSMLMTTTRFDHTDQSQMVYNLQIKILINELFHY